MVPSRTELYLWWTGGLRKQMWSIACYPSYTPEGGVPRARRIFRRYLPAEILTYLIINFLWAGLSLWLVSTLVSRTRVFTDREGASGGRSAATPRAQYTVTGSDSRGRLGRRAY